MERISMFIVLLISIVLQGGCGSPDKQEDILDLRTDQPNCEKEGNYCIRVATFNVAVGQFASAASIATKLAPLKLDVLTLSECPTLIDNGSNKRDFVEIIADALDMPYWEIGTISSGNHWQDWGTDVSGNYHGKLKAILSKTPLSNAEDILLNGRGWGNASVVRAETTINGEGFAIYSLHIPGSDNSVEGSVHKDLVDRVIGTEGAANVLITGDFNDNPENQTIQYIAGKGFKIALDDLENLENRIDPYAPGRIDHIFFNNPIGTGAIDGYSIYDSSISDHPVVWVKLLYTN